MICFMMKEISGKYHRGGFFILKQSMIILTSDLGNNIWMKNLLKVVSRQTFLISYSWVIIFVPNNAIFFCTWNFENVAFGGYQKYADLSIRLTEAFCENVLSHPFTVLRRQCQVSQLVKVDLWIVKWIAEWLQHVAVNYRVNSCYLCTMMYIY